MFEVECPDCRHAFDVGDDEQATRCPACGLELDLVEPGESTGGEPEGGTPGDVPDGDESSEEGPFEETPCPHCEGPLLLAPSDESGLCAHCERPLLFENQRALPFSQPPGAKAGTPTTPEVPAARAPPGSGFFDPNLEVTPQNAPLVECAPALNETAADPEPTSSSASTAEGTGVKKGKRAPKRSNTGKKVTKKKSAPAKKGGGTSAAGKRSSSRTSKKSKKRGKTTAKRSRGGRK